MSICQSMASPSPRWNNCSVAHYMSAVSRVTARRYEPAAQTTGAARP
jgi:hypothetical protein